MNNIVKNIVNSTIAAAVISTVAACLFFSGCKNPNSDSGKSDNDGADVSPAHEISYPEPDRWWKSK